MEDHWKFWERGFLIASVKESVMLKWDSREVGQAHEGWIIII